MNKPVEFFFDFVSPFGWFAAERIGGIARTHGRKMGPIVWSALAAANADHILFRRC
jgi:2-hydroxychromene-2-carboxylate isomerase